MKQNRSAEELVMRAIVVERLRSRWPASRIIHELPLRYSSRRIDLAAVTPTELIGVEIKSSRDVLDRLEEQIKAFVPVTHRLWVCLAPKHNEELPDLIVTGKDEHSTWTRHDRQFTPAQAVIERVGDRHTETWSVDAATGQSWQTRGGYLGSCDIRMPWHAYMLDMLWNRELAALIGGAGDRHDRLVAHANRVLTGEEIVRGVCLALRQRDAFDKASDPPIEAERSTESLPAEPITIQTEMPFSEPAPR